MQNRKREEEAERKNRQEQEKKKEAAKREAIRKERRKFWSSIIALGVVNLASSKIIYDKLDLSEKDTNKVKKISIKTAPEAKIDTKDYSEIYQKGLDKYVKKIARNEASEAEVKSIINEILDNKFLEFYRIQRQEQEKHGVNLSFSKESEERLRDHIRANYLLTKDQAITIRETKTHRFVQLEIREALDKIEDYKLMVYLDNGEKIRVSKKTHPEGIIKIEKEREVKDLVIYYFLDYDEKRLPSNFPLAALDLTEFFKENDPTLLKPEVLLTKQDKERLLSKDYKIPKDSDLLLSYIKNTGVNPQRINEKYSEAIKNSMQEFLDSKPKDIGYTEHIPPIYEFLHRKQFIDKIKMTKSGNITKITPEVILQGELMRMGVSKIMLTFSNGEKREVDMGTNTLLFFYEKIDPTIQASFLINIDGSKLELPLVIPQIAEME
jgi:hypothetical protein